MDLNISVSWQFEVGSQQSLNLLTNNNLNWIHFII